MLICLKKWEIIKHKNLLSHIKMNIEVQMFGNYETEKHKFSRYESPIF